MKRLPFGLIALAVVFAGLAALLLFQDSATDNDTTAPGTQPTTRPAPQVFPDVTVQAIRAIRLEDPNNGQSLTLINEEGEWNAPERPTASVDQDRARLIARTLEVLPYERTFNVEDGADLTQYGFLPEGSLFFIQLVLVDGTEHFVLIGNPVETGPPAFYALVDDRPIMYIVPRGAVDYLIDQMLNPPVS
jgi:hypothetical protein